MMLMPRLTGRNTQGVRYTWMFPCMIFAAGNEAMWVYEAHPAGPGRCRVTQTTCLPPETIALPEFEEKAEQYYHRLDTALGEDIPALEDQQRGLHPHGAVQMITNKASIHSGGIIGSGWLAPLAPVLLN